MLHRLQRIPLIIKKEQTPPYTIAFKKILKTRMLNGEPGLPIEQGANVLEPDLEMLETRGSKVELETRRSREAPETGVL